MIPQTLHPYAFNQWYYRSLHHALEIPYIIFLNEIITSSMPYKRALQANDLALLSARHKWLI